MAVIPKAKETDKALSLNDHSRQNTRTNNATVLGFSQKDRLAALLRSGPHDQSIDEELAHFLEIGIFLNDAARICND